MHKEYNDRSLAENSQDIVMQFNREHRHLYVNPIILQFHSHPLEGYIGKTASEMGFPKHLCELWEAAIERVFINGEAQSEFFESDTLKGTVYLDWRVFPEFNDNNEVESVLSVARDITQFKQAEEEAQKLQRLNSMGILAGGIAHDFNNILTALFGNISLAKKQLPQDHQSFQCLENAELAFQRANHLTRQLLTLSKGDTLVKQDVNISELAKEVAQFDLSGSNVKLNFEAAHDLWTTEVDKSQMQQVFSNLTINADQAMPNGGTLYISANNIELKDNSVGDLSAGHYIKFLVLDEGSGIEPKYIPQIFEPYFSTKNTGSGLGLATVHSIINKHDGHIEVSSNLNKGSSFIIYLPATKTQTVQAINPITENTLDDNKDAKILVMDDDEMIRELTSSMLERSGYTVEAVSNGHQAIEKYRQAIDNKQAFDCIIMDLTIPGGMGGAEANLALLALDPQAKTIVSSGYSADAIMENYAQSGFKGSITKPFNTQTLHDEIRRVLLI